MTADIKYEFTAWDAVAALDGDGDSVLDASRQQTKDINKWSQCLLEDARKWVRNGWEEGAAFIVDVDPVLGEGEVPQFEYSLGEEGSEVDIAKYLAHDPDCMGDMRVRPGQHPLVRIGVDLANGAHVDAGEMLKAGRSILAVVERLRAAGFPTQVDCIFSVMSTGTPKDGIGDGIGSIVVRVQDAGQPIQGGLLAFWVAHPGALRRAMFALCETLPMETRKAWGWTFGSGYGRPATGYLRGEYDEWAPSAQLGQAKVVAWMKDVLERRVGNA